jgi:Holliday junction resolvase
MNAKAKGTRLEHKSIKMLERTGYYCCRAAASLGLFDIIAIGPNGVRLVQVKANRNCGGVERERIEMFPVPTNCTKELWVWHDYAREPIITEIK